MADGYNKLGTAGVDLVRMKYKPEDGTVLSAQNAEMVLDKALGGRNSLRKRGGLTSTGAAFSSGVFELYEVRFLEAASLTPDPPGGSVSETFRPAADNSNVNWTTSPLWSKLDEVSPDDSDKITSDTSALSTAVLDATLPNTPGTFVAVSGTLSVRARLTTSTLPDGAQFGIVIDQSRVVDLRNVLTTSFQTFTLDLFTDLGYGGVAFDWSDVQFSMLRSTNPAGSAAFEISWCQLVMAHN